MALSEKYGLKVDPDALIEDITVGHAAAHGDPQDAVPRKRDPYFRRAHRRADAAGDRRAHGRSCGSLAAEGKSILFITHKLNEIMAVADRCTVLRKGKYIGTVEIDGHHPRRSCPRMMVGREGQLPCGQSANAQPGEVVLDVERMTVASKMHKKNAVNDVSLHGAPRERSSASPASTATDRRSWSTA